MSAETLSDLLPLPGGCRDPHAYQVFGLEEGEADANKIAAAIKATVSELKACKPSTDPKLWAAAAKLVQDARSVLSDPAKKAELDARFGIISVPEPLAAPPTKNVNASPVTSKPKDPLAGVLPPTDPLATVLPPPNPMAAASTAPQTSRFPNQPAPPDPTPEPHASIPSIAIQDERATAKGGGRNINRRQKSSLGVWMFGVFTLGMLSMIGILTYFLFFREGQVAITERNGEVSISTKPDSADPATTDADRPAAPKDPVMGSFAEDFQPGPNAGRPSGLVSEMDAESGSSLDGPSTESMTDPSMMNESDMNTASAMNTGSAMNTESPMEPESPAEPDMTPAGDAQPEMTPEPEKAPEPAPEPTAEMMAEADEALQRVEQLIADASWEEMKPAAEKLLEMPMNADQRERAESLHELADLATYYRGGIEKAVADLSVGNDFEVTPDFRVIVVEKGEDLLVVRYNERNRSFRLDELPFSLAHKLGTFTMPDSSGAKAAKAVYQAIAPKATEGHHEEAFDWLRAIDPNTEELNVDRVITTLESILKQPE